jgi:Icc-related predicted phosphoesterase
MRIAHISDTHDRPSIVRSVAVIECDVIVLTGDILNNKGRAPATGGQIIPWQERKYQDSWFRKQAKKWAQDFKGRPVVYVPGNHDFIGIERWLRHYGHDNLHVVSDESPFVDLLGKRFAGFRQVPWISGEWQGEEFDLKPHVDRAFACDPDILCTHAPPGGILDGPDGYGVPYLTSRLFYGAHKVTHHLFGHAHEAGVEVVTEGGIVFSNAAGGVNLLRTQDGAG